MLELRKFVVVGLSLIPVVLYKKIPLLKENS